ncbi:MAG: hypothetical protein JMDDDDMK_05326 [Acidobacteria bacterium]|nr:hypothetical protein [Acidobacteriota bacterium]
MDITPENCLGGPALNVPPANGLGSVCGAAKLNDRTLLFQLQRLAGMFRVLPVLFNLTEPPLRLPLASTVRVSVPLKREPSPVTAKV